MTLMLSGKVTLFNFLHSENMWYSTTCIPSGNTALSRFLHLENAALPNFLVFFGICNVTRLSQPSKATFSMICNDSGREIELSFLQNLKALDS